jgi:hypothetical protein
MIKAPVSAHLYQRGVRLQMVLRRSARMDNDSLWAFRIWFIQDFDAAPESKHPHISA